MVVMERRLINVIRACDSKGFVFGTLLRFVEPVVRACDSRISYLESRCALWNQLLNSEIVGNKENCSRISLVMCILIHEICL